MSEQPSAPTPSPEENQPPGARDYLDFTILVGPGAGRTYPVTATSTAGEASAEIRFPFDELALENRLQALQIALLRSGGTRRRIPSPEEQTVQDFGSTLFSTLFADDVRSQYEITRREAARQNKGVRVKLRIQPPELAVLPWEFLYNPSRGDYMVLSLNTPLVRYIDVAQPVRPLTVTPPLRILGVVANPDGLPSLDVERERERLERAVGGLVATGRMQLEWLAGQTWRDLQRAMRGGPWHIIHFIGHGGFDTTTQEGLMVLADDQGQPHALTASQLGRLLADHASLRLVLLNACEGAVGSSSDIFASTAATLVRRGIPAVLAMQYEITDRAAIEFSQSFYDALAAGLPVDAAVSEARKAISLAVANSVEWGTPVLFMRSPTGHLFEMGDQPLPIPPPGEAAAPPLRVEPAPKDGGRSWGSGRYLVGFIAAVVVIMALLVWDFNTGIFTGRFTQSPTPDWIDDGSMTATSAPATDNAADSGTDTATGAGSVSDAAPTPSAPRFSGAADTPALNPIGHGPVLASLSFEGVAEASTQAIRLGMQTSATQDDYVAGFRGQGLAIRDGVQVNLPLAHNGAPTIDLQQGELSFWYRPNFDTGDNQAEVPQHALVTIGSWDNTPAMILEFTERFVFTMRPDWESAQFVTSGYLQPAWTQGDWIHVRAVWNSNSADDALQIYINDRRVDGGGAIGGWQMQIPEPAQVLVIGARYADEIGLGADGVIDNFEIRGAPRPITVETAADLAEVGHWGNGRLLALDLSADGRRIVVGTPFGFQVLDATTFSQISAVETSEPVYAVAIAPDGSRIAAYIDDQVTLWDAASGHRMDVLAQNADNLDELAFSPDGTLVAGSDGAAVVLWPVDGSTPIRLDGHQDTIEAIAFSPDGALLGSGGTEGEIRLWDVAQGRLLETLTGHQDSIHDLAISSKNVVVSSAGWADEQPVRLWNTDGSELPPIGTDVGGDMDLAFSPDGNTLLLAEQGKDIHRWDMESGRSIRALREGTEWILAMLFAPNSPQPNVLMWTGGEESALRLWDLESGAILHAAEPLTPEFIGLQFSGDGRDLLYATDATLAVRSLTGALRQSWTEDAGIVEEIALGGDGTIASTTDWNGPRLRRLGQEIVPEPQALSGITAVAISPDGSLAVYGNGEGQIFLVDTATGNAGPALAGHEVEVSRLAYSADGGWLASVDITGEVVLWTMIRNQVADVVTLGATQGIGPALSLAISGDGSLVALGVEEGGYGVYLVDTANDGGLRKIQVADTPVSLAFAPDGSVLAVGGNTGIELLRVTDGAKLATVHAHRMPVTAVDFTPDGTLLASASRDGSIRFYGVAP